MLLFITAISLGFLGSFHCVGMCGPIALALPIGNSKGLKRLLLILSYNAGRIFTYSIFGLLMGLIGQGFVVGGYQQLLSIIIGSLLLISVIVRPNSSPNNKLSTHTFRLFNSIKNKLSQLFLKSGHRSLFTIGLLNGLLPCGLVYMGIAGAIATGNSLSGALFMAVFGLGTLPVMLSLPLFGNLISLSFRNQIRKAVPLIVGCMAVLLILRGLNLGIPYISPKIESGTMANCQHGDKMDFSHSKKTILCTGQNSVHKK